MAQTDTKALRIMVRGVYDLQKLRIQTGLRLCSNFRSRLAEPEVEMKPGAPELDAEAKKIIKRLKDEYGRLTDGIALRSRTMPDPEQFKGDAIISNHSELVLIDQYIQLEAQESRQFRQLTVALDLFPIYVEYLSKQVGIGPAMAGVLLAYFDVHKARHISSFWKYAGIDVAADGRGRSRQKEHLVEREYTDKNGKTDTRLSVTYEPFLKSKLMGVMASSFLRSNSPWRQVYDDYKHRLESDPNRIKVTVAKWKKQYANGDDVSNLWPPGRIHSASMRYMIKMFLADLWVKWREMEGLPVTQPYPVAKLGLPPHGGERLRA